MHNQTLYRQLARIDLELVARDETHVPQIGREADEELRLPRLEELDLAACGRLRARAGHHRDGAGIFPDALAREYSAIAQSHRQRHLHEVEWTNTLQVAPRSGHDVHPL